MKEDFFDRLDKYMNIKKLNDNQLTVKAGLPIGSLGKQRKGSRGLSVINIAKILYSCIDLNADWLITGRGEMLNQSENKSKGTVINETTSRIEEVLLSIINAKDNKIGELNQEVGKLKAQNESLEQKIEKIMYSEDVKADVEDATNVTRVTATAD